MRLLSQRNIMHVSRPYTPLFQRVPPVLYRTCLCTFNLAQYSRSCVCVGFIVKPSINFPVRGVDFSWHAQTKDSQHDDIDRNIFRLCCLEAAGVSDEKGIPNKSIGRWCVAITYEGPFWEVPKNVNCNRVFVLDTKRPYGAS